MEESTKYRFKNEEEFKRDSQWMTKYETPTRWNYARQMNEYIGKDIPNRFNPLIENGKNFRYASWSFEAGNCVSKEIKTSKELYNDILRIINTVSS